MAYNIMSQLSGPQIDVSLYSDAASKGIAAGNALPTKTTAAIQGFLKGVGQGQEIYENYQEGELRQNQIDQLPVQNARELAALEAQTLENQGAELDLQLKDRTQGQRIDATSAELEAKTLEAQNRQQSLEQERDLLSKFESADPATQASLLTSGEYAGVLGNNTNLAKSLAATAFSSGGLNQEQFAAFNNKVMAKETSDYYEKLARQRLPQFTQAKNAYEEDEIVQAASVATGLPKEVVSGYVELVPSGTYVSDPATKRITKDVKDNYIKGTPTLGVYDLIITKGPKAGTVVQDNIDAEVAKKYKSNSVKYKSELEIQNGAAARNAYRYATEQQQKQNQKPQDGKSGINGQLSGPQSPNRPAQYSAPNQPAFGVDKLKTWVPAENPEEDAVLDQAVQEYGSLSPERMQEAKPALNMLMDNIREKVENPVSMFTRIIGGDTAQNSIDFVKEDLARTFAKEQFDRSMRSSATFKKQYSPEAIARYNNSIREAKALALDTAQRSVAGGGFITPAKALIDFARYYNLPSEEVDTPEEMYFQKNKDLYVNSVDNLTKAIEYRYQRAFTRDDRLSRVRQEGLSDIVPKAVKSNITPPVPAERQAPSAVSPSSLSIQPEYEPYVEEAAEEFEVDPNLLRAIMVQESSGGRSKRDSSKGARGPMQLMAGTAEELEVDRNDPRDNIRGGAKYISKLLKQFNNNVELALAAYNAGPGAVSKHKGVPPYKETVDYVKNITELYGRAANSRG